MSGEQKTAKDIMYKTFGVSSKLDMMKSQFIGLADQGKIVVAMQEYADQQNAALKAALKTMIILLDRYQDMYGKSKYLPKTEEAIQEIIDGAKKLLDKQPQSESDGDKNLS